MNPIIIIITMMKIMKRTRLMCTVMSVNVVVLEWGLGQDSAVTWAKEEEEVVPVKIEVKTPATKRICKGIITGMVVNAMSRATITRTTHMSTRNVTLL